MPLEGSPPTEKWRIHGHAWHGLAMVEISGGVAQVLGSLPPECFTYLWERKHSSLGMGKVHPCV